ncbi:IS3 family transposase [Candidatus Binatus soli]|uniref:IS3 family transposase n=1 Tax=Candidatus Binatus soli TaxID=1953413 RepID=UPI003D0B80FE
MSKRGHTEEQILRALHQAEGGTRVSELCREHGISEATYYVWKKEYAGLGLSELRELRQLRGENAKLKRLVADLSLDRHMLQEIVRKKPVRPRHRRELGRWTQAAFVVSERRVSRLLPIQLATLRYRSRRDPQTALRMRLRELAASRVRFGYRRLTVLLRREGWAVNAKRIYRLYTEDGLAVRTKLRRKIARRQRVPLQRATRPHERLSMDFVSNRLLDGRWFRVLTMVDQFTRECLALLVDSSLTSQKVALALSEIVAERGAPVSITVDNGTEFQSKAMDVWAYQHGVQLDFIRPGRPTENGYIESFNGRLRDECLNVQVFFSVADARDKLERWRQDYNRVRPHSALGDSTPEEFANAWQTAAATASSDGLQEGLS